jgi:hypothetical protein
MLCSVDFVLAAYVARNEVGQRDFVKPIIGRRSLSPEVRNLMSHDIFAVKFMQRQQGHDSRALVGHESVVAGVPFGADERHWKRAKKKLS